MPKVTPRTQAPALAIDTLSGATWALADQSPDRFTMVVFYRGLHCPVCQEYVSELDSLVEDFAERGVDVIAVSGDARERAEEAREKWGLSHLEIGFGLDAEAMSAWDLHISSGLLPDEPDRFSEPGLFLVDAEGLVYYAATSSMPFGRPPLKDLLGGLDFVIEEDFPPRGVEAV